MTAKVLKFAPALIGEAYRFDADETLELAKGQSFALLAVIGELDDGTLWITGNANAGEMLLLMERIKHQLVFGEE